MATSHVSMDEVLFCFEDLEDPRSEVNRKHPLVSVVVIAIMGVLAQATGPTGIVAWADIHADFLAKLVPLPHGVPRKDVFRRVLCALKPDAFQRCFATWIATMRAKAEAVSDGGRPTLAVDGKTLRRSHDAKKGLGPLHSVSVWASEYGLTLAAVATEEKSNEITAIPEVLQLVDFAGAVVTIDAMGEQKAIAAQIIDGDGDYVLALKRNHETLHDAAADYMIEQMENDFADVEVRQHETHDKGHGRIETRQYIQLKAPATLPGISAWKRLMTIGAVILTTIRNGKETTETRFFISSLDLGVKQFAKAIRNHWGIENTCHWSLDVTYREDDSRIRDVRARENFAWLNRFTLSLLKQHSGKGSLAMKRRSCAWNPRFMLEIIAGQAV